MTMIHWFKNLTVLSFLILLCIIFFYVGNAIATVRPIVDNVFLTNRISGSIIPFIKNTGQVNEDVGFYAKTFGGTLFVTRDGELVYSLPLKRHLLSREIGTAKNSKASIYVLREQLMGSNGIFPKGEDKVETKINYFIGKDITKWKNGIDSYRKISFGEVYTNVDFDLKAYGNNIEKVFTIKPQGDVESIRIGIKGASIAIGPTGELEINTKLGLVKFTAPVAYQDIAGQRNYVKAAYVVRNSSYGFKVNTYDRNHALVIDPLLASTFVGGSSDDGGDDNNLDLDSSNMVLDSSGNVYIVGYTESNDYPTTSAAYQLNINDWGDIFVSKLSPDLSTMMASTFLGGNSFENGYFIRLDDAGNVFVTGQTESADFPTTAGGYDQTIDGGSDGFVAKLSNDLSQLLASTYIGGTFGERAVALSVDSLNDIYIAGWTSSGDYPVTRGAFDQTYNGNGDIFISKLSNDLSSLEASTFIGGSAEDPGYGYAVNLVVDSSDNVYVAGEMESSDYPITGGAYDTTYNSAPGNNDDVFISKLSGDLTVLMASTFIGGTDREGAYGLALDGSGNVYITGRSYSNNYPTTGGAYDYTSNGSGDIFVSKLPGDLSALTASTYIGGSDYEQGTELYIDGSGNVYLTGLTYSADFVTTPGAYDQTFNGGEYDAIVAKLSGDLSTLLLSTYLGGSGNDTGYALALNSSGDVYIAGYTDSGNYPITGGAYDPVANGGYDFFVSILSENSNTIKSGDGDGDKGLCFINTLLKY